RVGGIVADRAGAAREVPVVAPGRRRRRRARGGADGAPGHERTAAGADPRAVPGADPAARVRGPAPDPLRPRRLARHPDAGGPGPGPCPRAAAPPAPDPAPGRRWRDRSDRPATVRRDLDLRAGPGR